MSVNTDGSAIVPLALTRDANARDTDDMGLDCAIVSDATATGRKDLHEGSLGSICEEGGIFGAVTTTNDVLAAFS